jgi:hypothetical protein
LRADRQPFRGCSRLNGGDPKACGNAVPALVKLGERWTADDPRRGELAGRLAEAYPRLPSAGQQAALQICADWLAHGAAPAGVVHAASRLPSQVARSDDSAVRTRGLELVGALLEQPTPKAMTADCRDLAKVCLTDSEPVNRMRAARAAAHPGLGLLEQVAPLLNDPSSEVRAKPCERSARQFHRVVGQPLCACCTTRTRTCGFCARRCCAAAVSRAST